MAGVIKLGDAPVAIIAGFVGEGRYKGIKGVVLLVGRTGVVVVAPLARIRIAR